MNIRPKNMILYADTGVKFSQNNLGGANWRQQVFNNYRQHLLDQLAKYGEADDYGYWLNEMQSRHSNLYNLAGGEKGNWENIAYKNDLVGQYQQDYRGGLGNDGQYQRYGTIQISPDDRYDFNQTGIRTNQDTRYNIANPPSRVSGDYSREGYNYKVDNLYSAITDDRRLLGRKGDWDENSDEFKQWQSDLNKSGWETYLDTKDNYYKLRRLAPKFDNQNEVSPTNPGTQIPVGHQDRYGFDWGKLKQGAQKLFSNPDLWATARLAGNLINNERVYDEALKGIKPVLRQSYHTHRQVVGDEATKQAYYRRAAQGQTKAARPFTSDADRQMAYQFEAKRVGDELRAQGDLADNQEIRRTSDESNQHQWANTQRDTEVANANLASINQANSLRHNLLSQKHSAQWSSIDNYLQGIEYRKRQKNAEQQALDDQIFTLQQQQELANDPRIIEAQKAYQTTLDKHKLSSGGYDMNNDEVIEAKRKYQNLQTQIAIEQYQKRKQYYQNRGNIFSAKSGTKITHKKKDDLLYKSTKDVVEHFRKMSKMSSDAQNRKTPKIEKLTSHPKGKTKKYQQGGVAPFTIYKPVALGGETTTSTQTDTSSTKSSKNEEEKNTLDFIKTLFNQVQGLPIDTNIIYSSMMNLMQKADLFGNELSTNDLSLMYLQAMQQLSEVKYGKDVFEKAKSVATAKDSLTEFAVTASGKYITQDEEGNIKEATLKEIEEKGLNPITNEQLLFLRANDPKLALRNGNYLVENVINNGMGINKIGALIQSLAGNLGTTEGKLEGISQIESGKVKAGLQILSNASGSPDGYYSVSNHTKDQEVQVNAALKYISNMLSPSQKAILEIHGGVEKNILYFLGSQQSSIEEQTLSPLTGKASNKESKSGSGNGDNDMLPSVAFFNGLGEKDSFIIQDKTNDGLKINVISTPITSKGYNTGSITFDKLGSSDFGGQLLINQATMGDSLISSTGRNNIIIDGRIYQTELPIDQEAKRTTGVIKPDLRFLKNIEAADTKLKQMGIDKSDPKNIVTVNKIYQENNLPILYTISNNKPTITSEYARFAIVNGIGTENAFGDNPEFNDAIKEVSSDKERQQFETMMQQQEGNSKYKLDNGYGIGPISWGETKLYKGTIYIPMVTSNISALAGTGFKAKGEEYNEIEARQQAADAAREMGFNPAGNASNLQ